MGGNIALRLMEHGHGVVAYDRNADAIAELAEDGATPANSLEDLAEKLAPPRAAWVMLPAGEADRKHGHRISANCSRPGDTVIDGGNTFYKDDIRRARALLAKRGIHYVDVGTSGGVWGLERGYCMMIGGENVVGRPPRSDLRRAGAGPWRNRPHAAPRRPRSPRRTGLYPCRAARAPAIS